MNAFITDTHLADGYDVNRMFYGYSAGEILANIIRVRMKIAAKKKPAKPETFKSVNVNSVGLVINAKK